MDFWPSCGFAQLRRNARGWLNITPEYLRLFLNRPELALVPESCPAEIRLHQALLATPTAIVPALQLQRIKDVDVRHNYQVFLSFRDRLLIHGSVEKFYQSLFAQSTVDVPPVFIDMLVQVILRNVLDQADDPNIVRAAEILFRSQRIALNEGRVLAADREVVDMHGQTGGLGELGRLLLENKANLRAANLQVLSADNADKYWASSERHHFLLDLTHEFAQELSHGLTLRLAHARSGLKALAQVLELWVKHFLGVQVSIQPASRIDDPNWRWHLGLDPDSTALLNDLYEDRPVAPERMQRLISLFRLDFANPAQMRADVAGKPVYLGLCMAADNTLKLKPQNLLLNLPLAPHELQP
jgi:hypothetical protein